MGVMPFEQDDGAPVSCLEAEINALRFGADLLDKLPVAIDGGAAGRADLHQREAALVGGMSFEEVFDAAEALEDSLGVSRRSTPTPIRLASTPSSAQSFARS